jgi:hypothetical protein
MRILFLCALVGLLLLPEVASGAGDAPPFIHALSALYPLLQIVLLLIFGGMFVLAMVGGPSPTGRKLAIAFIILMPILLLISLGVKPGAEYMVLELLMIFFLPTLVTTCLFIAWNLTAMMQGWNYLFVKHSVAGLISPALDHGTSIDGRAVSEKLIAGVTDTKRYPMYHYENQGKKAKDLSRALNESADIAAARLKREQALAALEAAERDVENARAVLHRGNQ